MEVKIKDALFDFSICTDDGCVALVCFIDGHVVSFDKKSIQKLVNEYILLTDNNVSRETKPETPKPRSIKEGVLPEPMKQVCIKCGETYCMSKSSHDNLCNRCNLTVTYD